MVECLVKRVVVRWCKKKSLFFLHSLQFPQQMSCYDHHTPYTIWSNYTHHVSPDDTACTHSDYHLFTSVQLLSQKWHSFEIVHLHYPLLIELINLSVVLSSHTHHQNTEKTRTHRIENHHNSSMPKWLLLFIPVRVLLSPRVTCYVFPIMVRSFCAAWFKNAFFSHEPALGDMTFLLTMLPSLASSPPHHDI